MIPEVGQFIFTEDGFLGIVKAVKEKDTYFSVTLTFNDGEYTYYTIPK